MTIQNLLHHLDSSLRRNVREPNQSAMPSALEEHQISKILIHGDENPLLRGCPDEDRGIAGIGAAFPGLEDFVSRCAQPVGETTAGAPVDEELHEPETRTASRESCAMTA